MVFPSQGPSLPLTVPVFSSTPQELPQPTGWVVRVRTLLSEGITPMALFARLCPPSAPGAEAPVGFLLESADGDTRLARFSMLGVQPELTVSFGNGVSTLTSRDPAISPENIPFNNPLDVLKALLQQCQNPPGQDSLEVQLREQLGFVPPLSHGLVGYLGYGATRYFEGIPQQATDPLGVPDGFFGLYRSLVVFDHLYRRMHLIAVAPSTGAADARNRELLNQILDPACQEAFLPLEMPQSFGQLGLSPEAVFEGVTVSMEDSAYEAVVQQAKSAIQEGQVFQIVPARCFSLPVSAPALDMARLVQAINPSPYGYVLQCPGFTYLGSSPETFTSCLRNPESAESGLTVTLKALAGTRHRGKTVAEDLALEAELRACEKELAEHYMLVDLARNDLGRVCKPGSITVGELASVVRYTHVMHLSTEVQGQLRPEFTALDMVRACFPRGTVSGAPKIRAMQLLSQLEPERRGIYSGMVGYLDANGTMDSAIAIRSVLLKDGMAHVSAGAGVVYDSDPAFEAEETRNKAKSMLMAIQLAEKLYRGKV